VSADTGIPDVVPARSVAAWDDRADVVIVGFGFETVDAMEEALELPARALTQTLADYNRHAANGADPTFHKHGEWLKPLDAGPWAAFDLTPGNAFYVGFTLGGLATSVEAEVLRASDGAAIDGLYAAGACASNIAQDANGYSSGTCIGESSFFGRRAGRHVVGRRTTQREVAR